MTKIPPYLKKGDIIGLVAPAGYMPQKKFQQAIKILTNWGYNVLCGKTPGHQYHYFSGTDEERKNDLQQMLDNKDVRAIMCVRGGYGTGRIIDQLDFKKFKQNPKWIIGFSDVTILHSHIFSNYHIATLHAPMAGAFNNGEWKNDYVQSLRNALSGRKANYKIPLKPYSRSGDVRGTVVGGNLALLTHLLGTRSELDTKNKILFIEDVGEYIYNIDRMLTQMQRSGKLEKLAGLLVGSFNDVKDTTIPFGKTVQEVIHERVKGYGYPIAFGFPVGHEKGNYALKVGVEYELKVGRKWGTLKEI